MIYKKATLVCKGLNHSCFHILSIFDVVQYQMSKNDIKYRLLQYMYNVIYNMIAKN